MQFSMPQVDVDWEENFKIKIENKYNGSSLVGRLLCSILQCAKAGAVSK
jgi:hypothetical protein